VRRTALAVFLTIVIPWGALAGYASASEKPDAADEPGVKVQTRGVQIEPTTGRNSATPTVNAVQASPTAPVIDMVQQVRAGLPKGDLTVYVRLDPAKPRFVVNEYISIGFNTTEDAYVAVFVYSQDGSVTMLYPNDYARGQKVVADRVHWVGGNDQKYRIKVVPPFGKDRIHVVAFRNLKDLMLLLDELQLNKAAKELFVVDPASLLRSAATIRTRGLAIEGNSGVGKANAPTGWGDATTEFVTAPQ
jgi:hypothetical protein